MELKEKFICIICKSTEDNLAYEFETFGEQQDVQFTLTAGICYNCKDLFNFIEEK